MRARPIKAHSRPSGQGFNPVRFRAERADPTDVQAEPEGGWGSQYQEFVPAFPPPLAPGYPPPLGLVKYLTLFWPRLRRNEPPRVFLEEKH